MALDEHLAWARARVARLLDAGPAERVVGVIVMAADGVAAVGGRSAPLSSDRDRALLRAWRESADALLVGPATLAAERYGASLVPGRMPPPPVVTVDRSGTLDLDRALRSREPLPLVVYGRARGDERATWVDLPSLALPAVLADVRERFGARLVVAEPGPRLLAALLGAGVLTDLSVTVASSVVGDGPRFVLPDLPPADVEAFAGERFAHYSVRAPRGPTARDA